MNKTQLVDALAARTGDRRTAAALVDSLLETIVDTVRAGGTVSLSGFGVFESRARAERTARNPRTGAVVAVPATTVPAFRAGLAFRTAVGTGAQPAARTPAARRTRSAPAASATPAATSSAATEAAAVADAPAKVARGKSKVAATEAPSRMTGGKKKKTPAAEAPPPPLEAKAPAKKSAADKASTKKSAAKAKKDEKSKGKKSKK